MSNITGSNHIWLWSWFFAWECQPTHRRPPRRSTLLNRRYVKAHSDGKQRLDRCWPGKPFLQWCPVSAMWIFNDVTPSPGNSQCGSEISHWLQSCSRCCFTSFNTTNIHTVSPSSGNKRATQTVSCSYTFLSFRVGFTLEYFVQTSYRSFLREDILFLGLLYFFFHNYLFHFCPDQFC